MVRPPEPTVDGAPANIWDIIPQVQRIIDRDLAESITTISNAVYELSNLPPTLIREDMRRLMLAMDNLLELGESLLLIKEEREKKK
ncbi:unnamed protein product [marine sediment metagenome]|uniref:Uncharacterized protein n=1 Tax=marine sediment metagenome TaxID=412755 RepID=X1P828_9ZZZZ